MPRTSPPPPCAHPSSLPTCSADAEASALSSALIDSLLTDPGTFATTSAEEEKAQPDMSRVGMEGVIVTGNAAAETNAKLTQASQLASQHAKLELFDFWSGKQRVGMLLAHVGVPAALLGSNPWEAMPFQLTSPPPALLCLLCCSNWWTLMRPRLPSSMPMLSPRKRQQHIEAGRELVSQP